MKTAILLLCLSLFSVSVIRSEDSCCESTKTTSIEQKIRDIDLAIALKKYEQIQTERAKMEVQLKLAIPQDASDEQSLKKIEDRLNSLRHYASEIKSEILELSKPVAMAAK